MVSETRVVGAERCPVSCVLEDLSKTNYDGNVLYSFILELAEKGFASEHFRGPAA